MEKCGHNISLWGSICYEHVEAEEGQMFKLMCVIASSSDQWSLA